MGQKQYRFVGIVVATVVALSALLNGSGSVAAEDRYVIRYGDTLSHIAERHGLTVQQLVAINGIEDPDLIIAGDYLSLTTASAEAAQAASTAVDEAADEADVEEGEWTEDPAELPPYFDQWTVRWHLIDAARRYSWDPTLIMAQAWQESMWRQDNVSWVGAIGVMQVMPDTSAELSDWYFGYELDTWNSVADNIEAGVAFLTVLYETTGSVELALASYYQGWASVQRDGLFPDTKEYVKRIFTYQVMFQNGELP